MLFHWAKSRLSPIAVDFGADTLKLLQVTLSDPPQVVAAGAAVVPEHARTDPAARHDFYLQSLRHLLRGGGFKGNRAVCSIPAYQTLVQQLQVSKPDGPECAEEIAGHLRQRLNIDPSRVVVRSFPVNQVSRDGALRHEVVFLAASREVIMQHLETAHRAKLNVVGMHCEPLAVLKAFEHLFRGAEAGARTTCFIDVGAAATKVVIAHGAEMVFAKTIHAAGDHLTRHLARERNVSFAEARELRMAQAGAGAGRPATPSRAAARAVAAGVAVAESGGPLAVIAAQMAAEQGVATMAPARGAGAGGEGEAAGDGAGSTRPAAGGSPAAPSAEPASDADTLECLIDELALSLRYHQSMFPTRPVERLVFVGGESRQVDLCQSIAKSLRIGAQLGDPLARAAKATPAGEGFPGLDLSKPQPGWTVALGLCLSDIQA